jgi:hypothetical protein
MESEIVKDNYENMWLYSGGKSLAIDSIEEIQAIKDACIIFLEELDREYED